MVISKVFLVGVPFDLKLLSFNLVCNPEVSHFHGARALAFDSVVCNASCGGIVKMNRGQRLWVSKFMEDEADDMAFFGVFECTEFSFSGRCGNKFENGAYDMDGTIQLDG